MKKIVVKEYEPGEQLVIVYELTNQNGINDYDEKPNWKKISVYDPMVNYSKKALWGKGKDCDFLARNIISEFNLSEGKSKEYLIDLIKRVNEYLENILIDSNSFIILEKDVEHLLYR